jgi:F-type H+-transporting ATPase subunit b
MDLILHQLGELVLGSVPTMIFFVLLIAAYEALVRRPLERTLAERRARTSGALEQARGALSAAEAETTVYEDKLRGAKAEIFTAREQMLKRWSDERETALGEVRRSTQERVQASRREIEESAVAARAQIESTSGALTTQILRAVLPAGISLPEANQ